MREKLVFAFFNHYDEKSNDSNSLVKVASQMLSQRVDIMAVERAPNMPVVCDLFQHALIYSIFNDIDMLLEF
jgi:hypothetical protein